LTDEIEKICTDCIMVVFAEIARLSYEKNNALHEALTELQFATFYFGYKFGKGGFKTKEEKGKIHIVDDDGKKVCDCEFVELVKRIARFMTTTDSGGWYS